MHNQRPDAKEDEVALRFRRFTVVPGARRLFADGVTIELGSRAFDLLVVLLQSAGRVVSKTDIFAYVWPSTIVEESNLRFQMAALRSALGPDRDIIKTVPGRGYLLIAEPSLSAEEAGVSGPGRAAAANVATSTKAVAGSANPTIAVIDDDEGVRDALEGLLTSAGLPSETFASVQAYRDRHWAEPPACIILDVWLPGTSGIDFQDEMASEGRHPPVIFISGHADVHTSVRAMKAGAVEFLTKPVRHQELLDAVQSAIAS